MKKLISLILTLSLSGWCLPSHAQSVAEQVTIGTQFISSGHIKWAPISTTAPLPVSVYGGTATQCYTSNGPGLPATFQACGGGGGGITALTGVVTASGTGSVVTSFGTFSSATLAAALSDESGTGLAVFNNGPTFIAPALGTPASGVATNLTGTAAGLTAGNVTTNANLTGVITSVGNATSIASQTGTGTKFVVDTSPTLVTPIVGVASGTSMNLSSTDTASAFIPTGTAVPSNGFYLPAANTPSIAANTQPIAKFIGTSSAVTFYQFTNSATAFSTGTSITAATSGGASNTILGLYAQGSGGQILFGAASINITAQITASGGGIVLDIPANANSCVIFGSVTVANCALAQAANANEFITGTASGDTVVHAASGKDIAFGVGTTMVEYINSSFNVGIGTAAPQAKLDVLGPVKTQGYAVGSLPTGVVGMRAYVTDQTTTCPAAGAALTGGGVVTCPVFFNGTIWTGD